MATDVNQLQVGLDRIASLASSDHFGASDRRRTMVSISNICVHATQGTLGDLYEIPDDAAEKSGQMTYDSLYHDITQILSRATFSTDNYGQLVIYTDKTFGEDNRTLVQFEVKEEDNERKA